MSIGLPTRQSRQLLYLARTDPDGQHDSWLDTIAGDDDIAADGYHLDPLQLLMRAEDVDLHLDGDEPC